MKMFDATANPKTSNRKRLFGLLAFLGFAMAIVEVVRYLQMRLPIHAGMACIWLVVGAVWGYRVRRFGKPRATAEIKTLE
jgi:hypothetical protein